MVAESKLKRASESLTHRGGFLLFYQLQLGARAFAKQRSANKCETGGETPPLPYAKIGRPMVALPHLFTITYYLLLQKMPSGEARQVF